MSQSLVTVGVGGGLPLDMAGLALIIESLPGLLSVSPDANPPPQVLVWDARNRDLIDLPPLSPQTAVLLLIADEEIRDIPQGIAGLFSKRETPIALGVAIRQVARGQQYLSPSLALAILKQVQAETVPPAADLRNLTEREREILTLLSQGLSNKAIASRLYLSVRTVEGHLAKLYSLLRVHSRTEAMLAAIRSNLASLDR